MIDHLGHAGDVFVCLILLLAVTPIARADEEQPDFFGSGKGQRVFVGLDANKCAMCHGKTQPVPNKELPIDVRGSDDGWIVGNELLTWVNDDLHYQAFAVLLGKQSKKIAERMGIVDSNAHRDRRCLACHSSVPVEYMTPMRKGVGDLLDVNTEEDLRFTIGVSCEACHGPAGAHTNGPKGWGEGHVVDRLWRTMSPKSKYETYGYWDVHSTRTQTRICLSCHLGSVEQNKVITHEMYAAGHPPLPSFELSQFIRRMPRHWRRLDEKRDEVRDKFLKDSEAAKSPVKFDPEEFATTKATMIAALVTLEESMRLSGELMGREPTTAHWPELANYSCYACHHELQRDGWRKKKRFTSKPGRPPLQEWPFALSHAVTMAMKEENGDFEMKVQKVAAALDSKPYGDLVDLKAAVTEIAEAAKLRSKILSRTEIRSSQATDLLKSITRLATAEKYIDYDSARQIMCAYERTYAELELRRQPMDKPHGKWTGDIDVFKDFDNELLRWLPENRKSETEWENVKLGSGKQEISHKLRVVKVSEVLERISKYQPQLIQEGFRSLPNPPAKIVESQKRQFVREAE